MILLALCAKSIDGESEFLIGFTRLQQTLGADEDLSLGAKGAGVVLVNVFCIPLIPKRW